jgi:soluble lytic murein transglycosylase
VTKPRAVLLTVVVLFLVIIIVIIFAARQPVPRHRVFRTLPAARPIAPAAPEDWTAQFAALENAGRWKDLAALLAQIETTHAAEYARWSLGYLHARALIEAGEPRAAAAKLAPFLAPGNPLRDLALFHQSEIDDSSATRQQLIFQYPKSIYREQVIEDELDSLRDLKSLQAFAAKLPGRDVNARLAERGDVMRGIALLKASTTDDAADRASRALDRPEVLRRLNGAELTLVGAALFNHRHFDRAVAVLSLAPRSDQNTFDLGRAWFGDEKYAQAQQVYQRGAAQTRDAKWKTTFLWHASRAAQLQGNDAAAEQLMTAAIAVPGRFPATSAALTQRLRTRVKQRRFAEAAADLNAIRQQFPKDHAVVEASLAYALGNPAARTATFNAIPPALLDAFDRAEIDYWRGRYLDVLRAPVPTHFAYFARRRLDRINLQRQLAALDGEARKQIAAGNWEAARKAETDRYLLSPRDARRLAGIYRHIPAYAAIIDKKPQPFPRFPLSTTDRGELLMAMGLFDEAVDDLPKRWDLLTRSLALNRGNASHDSIREIEIFMNSVPNDFVPQLLPLAVRELLYPRYFYDAIVDDAKKFDTDPVLLLSIMREESRFDPRAKSEAAARGLLQFIITTANEIGREVGLLSLQPDDLYDPRVVIRLGAKYVSELSKRLGGDRYAVAAAYNAGPYQVALWQRLAPAPGDDAFLSAINFDETKQYVRKVMNSYERYVEIYGHGAPAGGVRVEP